MRPSSATSGFAFADSAGAPRRGSAGIDSRTANPSIGRDAAHEKEVPMRRCLLVVGVSFLFLTPAVADAAPGGDLAKGRGLDFFGPPFSFRASSNFNGTDPDGTVRLGFNTGTGGLTEFHGDVTCLRVAAGLASIGGRVTKIDPPAAVFGGIQSFIIQTSDGGKFSPTPDTVSYGVSTAPPPPATGCPAPTGGLPLTDGDIVVQDALS
jgi:hypothetical protein